MANLRRISREHSLGNLDRIVQIDGRDTWSKKLDDSFGAAEEVIADTLASYSQETLQTAFLIHFDPAVLPGQTVTDEGDELTIDSVSEVGRRRWMILQCSVSTPASTPELVG